MGFIERHVNHVPRRRTQLVLLYIPFHGTTVTLARQRLKVKIAEAFASVRPTRSQYLRQLLSSTMVPADLSIRVATSSLGTGGKCKCFFDALGTSLSILGLHHPRKHISRPNAYLILELPADSSTLPSLPLPSTRFPHPRPDQAPHRRHPRTRLQRLR